MGRATVGLGHAHTELRLTQSEGSNSSPPAQLLLKLHSVPVTLASLLIQLIVQVVVMSYFGESKTKDWFLRLSRPTLLADVSGQMSQRAQREAGLTVNSVSTSRKRQILALSGDIKSFFSCSQKKNKKAELQPPSYESRRSRFRVILFCLNVG